MSRPSTHRTSKRWYQEVPDPMVLIFFILLLTYALTFIIAPGSFERHDVDGRTVVIPESFHYLTDASHLNPFRVMVAIPEGLLQAAQYLFITFIAGGLFNVLEKTKALENIIGTVAHRTGAEDNPRSRNLIITIAILVYGFFGVAVGFENNIALVPIAIIVAAAIGTSRIVGTVIAVGGIGIGFALSPINPYTVGVAHQLSDMPLFSGWGLRTIVLLAALLMLAVYTCTYVVRVRDDDADDLTLDQDLSDYRISRHDIGTVVIFVIGLIGMLYGVFRHGWFINEIATVFLIMGIVIGIHAGLTPNRIVKQLIEGAAAVTGGALVIGLAASIRVLLENAEIIDTIIFHLSHLVQGLPIAAAAILTSIIQGVINFFIPSGSGQALATMPIFIPLADIIGMSRELMISAFQIGDGVTNLIIPTSGGTLAMLALAKTSFVTWLRVIFPLIVLVYIVCWIGLIVGYYMGY